MKSCTVKLIHYFSYIVKNCLALKERDKKHERLEDSMYIQILEYFIPEGAYFWFRRAQWSYLWFLISSFPFPYIEGDFFVNRTGCPGAVYRVFTCHSCQELLINLFAATNGNLGELLTSVS